MKQVSNVESYMISKTEAIKRMGILGLEPDAIKLYEEESIVLASERGYFRELREGEEVIIRNFEEKNGCVVYHVISTPAPYSDLLEMFFVRGGKQKTEKILKRKDYLQVFCMAYNFTVPDWSDIGYIRVKNVWGTLLRIA